MSMQLRYAVFYLFLVGCMLILPFEACAEILSIERVSVSSSGAEGNGWSGDPGFSEDGRYVVFDSTANNLAPGGSYGYNVFVRDRQTGTTTLESITPLGYAGYGWSGNSAISADGLYVSMSTSAADLVDNDYNGLWDIVLRDRGAGQNMLASVASDGTQGNAHSFSNHSLSATGRYVAFLSLASNLVPNDSNSTYDIFVRDRITGQTTMESVSSQGIQGNGPSGNPYGAGGIGGTAAINYDGRFVAFVSLADNLVTGDTNGMWDIFVRDRKKGSIKRVSVSSEGTQGNGNSGSSHISVSSDGRFIVFDSMSDNLVQNDVNGQTDVFVHDRDTDATTLVSVSSAGNQGNSWSGNGGSVMSADGRYVAFISAASNLVPNDLNGQQDIFVHDMQTGITELVSLAYDGAQANGLSERIAISADGKYVAFSSYADNLVPGDFNGQVDVFVVERVIQ